MNFDFGRIAFIVSNGTIRYSKVALIKTSTTIVRSLSPNPFKAQIQVIFELDTKMPVTIKLFSTTGSEILVKNLSGEKGINRLDISTPRKLPNGVYILSLHVNNETTHYQVIKNDSN